MRIIIGYYIFYKATKFKVLLVNKLFKVKFSTNSDV